MGQAEDRTEYLQAILDSASLKKLIVAGPGAGKTHTFRELLKKTGGPALALTFIRALAGDLAEGLGDLAKTFTFHGYGKHLLHTTKTDGISLGVDYYPAALILIADDLTHLNGEIVDGKDVERDMHNLDASALVDGLLRSGNYYDAVSHVDAVYRVYRHLEANPDAVPAYRQLVVDEYQDFSLLEVNFIRLLADQSPILVAGDDDQALYGFRHASAIYIRDLAGDEDYTRFELPFCSRCTEVLVQALHTVIVKAQALGLLEGRLDKRYECYLPDKAEDSEKYSTVVHAHCTVQRGNAPYMARYIEGRINAIPPDEIVEASEKGYPAVLITGPKQFVTPMYTYLSERFPNVTFKQSMRLEVSALDGYRRLVADPQSRLGWRILLYARQPAGLTDVLKACLLDGAELVDLLDEQYRDHQMAVAALVQRAHLGEALSDDDLHTLEAATGLPFDALLAALDVEPDTDVEAAVPSLVAAEDEGSPTIMVTSLVGSKGLQAAHVFVVGVNEGHFPRDNTAPTDSEVCSLLVALTRAKKSCTLVSCGRFGDSTPGASIFVQWLSGHVSTVTVNKSYFEGR